MQWLTAFKGLRKIGVPPALVAAGLLAYFVYMHMKDNEQAENAAA